MIKQIIFDLGVVIVDVDFNRTINAFRQCGVGIGEDIIGIISQHPCFVEYETGSISTAEFIATVKKLFNSQIPDSEFIDYWNRMIVGFPKERIWLLKELRNKYRTFLLSNTNELHIEYCNSLLTESFALTLEQLFESAYYSNVLGMKKPDSGIYQYVLNQNDLKAAETLFLDDREENIEAAARLGIQTVLITQQRTMIDVISEIV